VFRAELQQRFRDDEITITPQGQVGADITQRVRTGGRECGVILWECKRTARWDGRWPGKLARDAGKTQANLAVIVSEALPRDADGSCQLEDGLWVCDYRHAAHLAAGLRQVLINVWRYSAANAARAGGPGAPGLFGAHDLHLARLAAARRLHATLDAAGMRRQRAWRRYRPPGG
jgi:hypothetical protein